MNDMGLKITRILDEHHLLFQRLETLIFLNVVTDDIAHNIVKTKEEQYRDLVRRPYSLHQTYEREWKHGIVQLETNNANLVLVEPRL